MARHSAFEAPRFLDKRVGKRRQASLYFFWWECLRRNDSYRKCCQNDGRGKLARLYADFGNVYETTFDRWWNQRVNGQRRGEYLFAEPEGPATIVELHSPDEWARQWTPQGVAVIAIPLRWTRERLKRRFASFLAKRHVARPAFKAVRRGHSRYPVSRYAAETKLAKMLAVYDLQRAKPHLPLADIGRMLRLSSDAMPKPLDPPATVNRKRNVMRATVSRYLKQITQIIENTAKGTFPTLK